MKLWTTNGVVADLLVVMARVPKSEGHRGGITAFVVEAGSEGVTVENRNAFMGLRGLENGVTRFHRVRVPASHRIGEEGQGLKIALTTLNTGRLSLPAMCVGAGKWCLKIAREWSAAREQWGKPVALHEAVGSKIAFIAATTFALEAVLDLSADGGRPVDSEHAALFQALAAGTRADVRRLVVTASGGPFRGRSREEFAHVTVEDALAHPTWAMGPVITINSATLVNKGLEVIEAHLLYDIPFDRIEVVVHPQSYVHSMVEFTDGSTLAQATRTSATPWSG
ncbi:1-deoxy-D-xylulose 5-phosphate reductoisomerase [Streptomyces griseomycini]